MIKDTMRRLALIQVCQAFDGGASTVDSEFFSPLLRKAEQIPNLPLVLDGHMEIHTRRQQAGVSRRSFHLGQGSAAGQRMADESVPPVVDGERAEPVPAQDPAGGPEPEPKNVAVERMPRSPRYNAPMKDSLAIKKG